MKQKSSEYQSKDNNATCYMRRDVHKANAECAASNDRLSYNTIFSSGDFTFPCTFTFVVLRVFICLVFFEYCEGFFRGLDRRSSSCWSFYLSQNKKIQVSREARCIADTWRYLVYFLYRPRIPREFVCTFARIFVVKIFSSNNKNQEPCNKQWQT